MALTAKQQRFVQEYLIDLNATQAAIRAGYSEKTAGAVGHENLNKPEIAAALQIAQRERSHRTGITADRVLAELGRVALSDIRQAFTETGHLREIGALGDDTAAAIAGVEVVVRPTGETDEAGNRIVEHVHKIKLWDKNSALDKLARHLGLLVERHEVTGKNGGPIEVRARDVIASRIAGIASRIGAGKDDSKSD